MNRFAVTVLTVALALGSGLRLEAQDRFREERARAILLEAINTGTPIFNQGDAIGCYRVYQGALSSVMPLLNDRPNLRTTIVRERIEAARQATDSAKAWRLRRLIDLTLEVLR